MRLATVGGIVVVLLAVLLIPQASAQACSMLTDEGWQPDADCDSVPDRFDNCPLTPNSQQMDMNRNGMGDACDLIIEEVIVQPDTHIRQGEFAHVIIRIINNRGGPIDDVSVRARHTALGIDAEEFLEQVPAGESANIDFWLKVPKCASIGRADVSITSSFEEPYTGEDTHETMSVPLDIEQNDLCGTADGPLDNTIIDVFGSADMDVGESAILPVKIMNRGDAQKIYHLSIEDLGMWGTWRIDPAASVAIPAGHEATMYIYLQTDEDTRAGIKDVQLLVTSDGQQTAVPIHVYVRAPLQRAKDMGTFFVEALLIVAAMLVIGIIALLIVLHMNRRHKKVAIEDAEKEKKTNW